MYVIVLLSLVLALISSSMVSPSKKQTQNIEQEAQALATAMAWYHQQAVNQCVASPVTSVTTEQPALSSPTSSTPDIAYTNLFQSACVPANQNGVNQSGYVVTAYAPNSQTYQSTQNMGQAVLQALRTQSGDTILAGGWSASNLTATSNVEMFVASPTFNYDCCTRTLAQSLQVNGGNTGYQVGGTSIVVPIGTVPALTSSIAATNPVPVIVSPAGPAVPP